MKTLRNINFYTGLFTLVLAMAGAVEVISNINLLLIAITVMCAVFTVVIWTDNAYGSDSVFKNIKEDLEPWRK